MRPMALDTSRISGCKPTLLVHNSLPWQVWITKVGYAADNTSSTWIPTKCSNLAISHNSPTRNLGYNSINTLSEIITNLFHGNLQRSLTDPSFSFVRNRLQKIINIQVGVGSNDNQIFANPWQNPPVSDFFLTDNDSV